MIASTIVTPYVQADTVSDRKNNNLDKHIAKGGAHGAEAQRIKNGGCGVGGGSGGNDCNPG